MYTGVGGEEIKKMVSARSQAGISSGSKVGVDPDPHKCGDEQRWERSRSDVGGDPVDPRWSWRVCGRTSVWAVNSTQATDYTVIQVLITPALPN